MNLTSFKLLALLSLLFVSVARADRGSIPFKPHVQIFEPTQRAMIAWDGREEILVLSTDLRASEPTKVLEVILLGVVLLIVSPGQVARVLKDEQASRMDELLATLPFTTRQIAISRIWENMVRVGPSFMALGLLAAIAIG